MALEPFTIQVPQETLDDMRNRLAGTRWPDAIRDGGWDYGADLAFMQSMISYWGDGFDWRAQEKRINEFPQFRTKVDDVDIHFIHQCGHGDGTIPLILLHGWPSSFVQMLRIIPLLADSFDVVVPSLPGYGFSDRATERGMSVGRIAGLFHTLMTEVLGYERYGGRGSDLGAGVLQQLALQHPNGLIGLHLSGTSPYVAQVPNDLTSAEREFLAKAQQWNMTEMAYAMEHSSKPQTLAYGLNDSPAGLAAWILEKFWRWSDNGGNLENIFSRDDLLTNLTIYWATGTIGSSMRLYYETARDPGRWGRVEVPTGMLMSPKDMFPTPQEWAARSYNVVRWKEIDRGGHFLEWEQPELVADDLHAFFHTLHDAGVGQSRRSSVAGEGRGDQPR